MFAFRNNSKTKGYFKMASRKKISEELDRMKVLYWTDVTAIEARIILDCWDCACSDVSDDEFENGCKEHRRTSRSFPYPVDILSIISWENFYNKLYKV